MITILMISMARTGHANDFANLNTDNYLVARRHSLAEKTFALFTVAQPVKLLMSGPALHLPLASTVDTLYRKTATK